MSPPMLSRSVSPQHGTLSGDGLHIWRVAVNIFNKQS